MKEEIQILSRVTVNTNLLPVSVLSEMAEYIINGKYIMGFMGHIIIGQYIMGPLISGQHPPERFITVKVVNTRGPIIDIGEAEVFSATVLLFFQGRLITPVHI